MGKSKKSKDEMNHEIVGHEEKPKKKKKKDRVDEEDAPVGEGMVEVKVEGGGGSRKTGGGGGTELRIRDITRHTGTSKVGRCLGVWVWWCRAPQAPLIIFSLDLNSRQHEYWLILLQPREPF